MFCILRYCSYNEKLHNFLDKRHVLVFRNISDIQHLTFILAVCVFDRYVNLLNSDVHLKHTCTIKTKFESY